MTSDEKSLLNQAYELGISKKFRLKCIENGKTMKGVLRELMGYYVESEGKIPSVDKKKPPKQ